MSHDEMCSLIPKCSPNYLSMNNFDIVTSSVKQIEVLKQILVSLDINNMYKFK